LIELDQIKYDLPKCREFLAKLGESL